MPTPSRRPPPLRLEPLEGRDTPGVLTTTYAAGSRTLTVVGDSNSNNLTVNAVPGPTFTKWLALSSPTDTFAGETLIPNVENVTVRVLGGDDSVTFDTANGPIRLLGNLAVNGGDGANNLWSTDLTVGKNFTVTNGMTPSGSNQTDLTNLTVGGALTVNNGNGYTFTTVHRNSAGRSVVGGDITITNGTGVDANAINDTEVGGNVTVRNGRGSASGVAGHTWIYNDFNTARSHVRGNVAVSYLNGDVSSGDSDVIRDAEVLGNVAFAHGTGRFDTFFDGYSTPLPVVIRGNLTVTGTGPNTVTAGTQFKTGLVVGKDFTVTTGGAADAVTLNKVEVGGNTRLSLGDGASTVTIDDSVFAGTFNLTTGRDADLVYLDTATGSSGPTVFERAVVIRNGAGADHITRTGAADGNQQLVMLSTFVVHFGVIATEGSTFSPAHESFPFGGFIDYVP